MYLYSGFRTWHHGLSKRGTYRFGRSTLGHMSKKHATFESPLGTLTVLFDGGRVVGLYQEDQPNIPSDLGEYDPSLRFHPAAAELHRYFISHSPITTDTKVEGTAFQNKVWKAVSEIPFGKTVTYGELAETIGSPKSVRAVASAVAANPITVIIPCHRVVSSNGAVKYSGGEKNKRYLLAHEGIAA